MGRGMEDPEDAIDDRSKIVKGMACLAVMSTVRQEGAIRVHCGSKIS